MACIWKSSCLSRFHHPRSRAARLPKLGIHIWPSNFHRRLLHKYNFGNSFWRADPRVKWEAMCPVTWQFALFDIGAWTAGTDVWRDLEKHNIMSPGLSRNSQFYWDWNLGIQYQVTVWRLEWKWTFSLLVERCCHRLPAIKAYFD